jgi:hypothetical protein
VCPSSPQIKILTLPLNYKQIESTTKMQMIQPKARRHSPAWLLSRFHRHACM